MDKLETNFKKQLYVWLGGKKHLTLLFQGTRDGCDAQTFHNHCINKGATITACYNIAGYVFGGYTTSNLTSSNSYQDDANVFLFRTQVAGRFQPKRYPVKQKKSQYAVYDGSNYGPKFGGHDFYSFTNTVYKTASFFLGNGYTVVGHSYDMIGDDATASNGNNLQFTDIEVYQVTDNEENQDTDNEENQVPESAVSEIPWRKLPDVNEKAIKSELDAYKPPGRIANVNILLVGAVGAGKSSYYNTINSIFQGRITSVARNGSAEHSLTTTYRTCKVKSAESGHPMKIRLCDTRGIEEGLCLDLTDIMAIVERHIQDRFVVLN